MPNTNGDPEEQTDEARVALNVAHLREERGWSQGDLARAMVERGHSWYQTTVSRVEKGDRPLRLVEGLALADAFGVRVDALAGDPEVQDLMAHLFEQHRGLVDTERDVRRQLRALNRFRSRLQQVIADLAQRGVVDQRIEHAQRALAKHTGDAVWERIKEEELRGQHHEEA